MAAAATVMAVTMAGAGVAQGHGGRRAEWRTFEETWVLEADGDRSALVLPGGSQRAESTLATTLLPGAHDPGDGRPPDPALRGQTEGEGDEQRQDDDETPGAHDGEAPAEDGGETPSEDGVEAPDEGSGLPPLGSTLYYTDGVYRGVGRGFRAGRGIGDEGGQYDFGVDRVLGRISFDIRGRETIEASFSFTYESVIEEETDPVPPFELAIIGGTGEFRGISGEITISDDTDANDPDDTVGKATIDAVLPWHGGR